MASAFDRIMSDPHLALTRRKLSADEILTIIRHVWAADDATAELPFHITVNGKDTEWSALTISHEQLCALAGEPTYASATYSYRVHDRKFSGVTFKGKAVSVFPDMQFDCVVTGDA